MTTFPLNGHRHDPYKNFKFKVKWNGVYIPGISKVSPLKRMTETIFHRDGDDSSSFRVSPGTTSFEPIVLERGITHDKSFEEWANMVYTLRDQDVSLANYKKDIIIELYNLQGSKVMAFHVYRCWVSEYQPLSELDANNPSVAIEKLVLVYESWERDPAVMEPVET